jgi:hypothetical protein
MSYMITIKFPAVSAATAEGVARDQEADRLKRIIEDGQQHGCIHHMFTEDTDGAMLVVDEWPDEATFQRFMQGQQEISKVTEAMGGSPDAAPEVTTRRILDTPDRF